MNEYYIVVVISSENDPEERVLEVAGISNDKDWCYAALKADCTNPILSKPGDDNSQHVKDYEFFLINPKCWECEGEHYKKCSCENDSPPSGKVRALLDKIKGGNKKIIVWTHKGDEIAGESIKKVLGERLYSGEPLPFNHDDNKPPEIFMNNVCQNRQNNFQSLFKEFVNKSLEDNPIISSLLHLFLPLDIDMQAMEILWNGKKDKAKAIKYLEEMLEDTEKKYTEKFAEAQKLLDNMHDAELKNKLENTNMIGNSNNKDNSILYKFLECLDNLKEKAEHSEISEKDVGEVLGYFKSISIGYDSFHDYYCALAKCLRGEEGCKD